MHSHLDNLTWEQIHEKYGNSWKTKSSMPIRPIMAITEHYKWYKGYVGFLMIPMTKKQGVPIFPRDKECGWLIAAS